MPRGEVRSGIVVSGYEMLTGLAGVETHTHRGWLPIIENSQRYDSLSRLVGTALLEIPPTLVCTAATVNRRGARVMDWA